MEHFSLPPPTLKQFSSRITMRWLRNRLRPANIGGKHTDPGLNM